MQAPSLNASDKEQIQARGLSLEDALRQLALLRTGRVSTPVERAATVGDGIVRWSASERERYREAYREAADRGRAMQFIPASGAATRMFKSLLAIQGRRDFPPFPRIEEEASGGNADAGEFLEWFHSLEAFPFFNELEAALRRRGAKLRALMETRQYRPILECLLLSDGLGYAHKPKALIPFHSHEDGSRIALEEHLSEAAHLVRDGHGRCRVHFTISPGHAPAFAEALQRVLPKYETGGLRYEIGFSVQDPATDTLTTDLEGRPLRNPDGSLAFRPGGHGALLQNLYRIGGDIVFIKNIDNIVPDPVQAGITEWRRALGGCLVVLREESFRHLASLRASADPERVEKAAAFVEQKLGTRLPDGLRAAGSKRNFPAAEKTRDFLAGILDRPLRVCAVIPDTGEPGGGPFWVRNADGSSGLQIVESPQIDMGSETQKRIAASSTHFSPTDLVCALRNGRDEPYPLAEFVDPETWFITTKTKDGMPVRALEAPGLWNGSMARWNTVFIETPAETFNPVKTVMDLLRPAHRTGSRSGSPA